MAVHLDVPPLVHQRALSGGATGRRWLDGDDGLVFLEVARRTAGDRT